MLDLLSEETRREPFAAYAMLRERSPLVRDPNTRLWMIFDYDGVKRVLTEWETFSSRHGPVDWIVSLDPPRQAKLRALVSKAFTPKSVANLEPRIRELSRELLEPLLSRGEMDLAADYSIRLPMMVIAEMLGVPSRDLPKYVEWSNAILNMSYTVGAREGWQEAVKGFTTATGEMSEYLSHVLNDRSTSSRDNLLTRLAAAELDGQRLTHQEMLGFLQLLLVAGQETTTNLINNAILCFLEHPQALRRIRDDLSLLPAAIEETLRYRSPIQWMYRKVARDVELHGQTVPSGTILLAMIGSANRDEKQFERASDFDPARDPNPHLSFGHGLHFCLGAPLARLEARIALTDLLAHLKNFELAIDGAWTPRRALHVHGPERLPLRFRC
jgi:cytochrome P450